MKTYLVLLMFNQQAVLIEQPGMDKCKIAGNKVISEVYYKSKTDTNPVQPFIKLNRTIDYMCITF